MADKLGMADTLEPRSLSFSEALRAELGVYAESPSVGAGFRNPWEHPPLPGLAGVLRWKARTNTLRTRGYRPAALPLPAQPLADFEALAHHPTRVFWIGHASFMVDMEGTRVVIDPIFGRAGGLVPRVTPPAAQPEELGSVSAVLVTHGHHDHLDPGSLKRLADHGGGKTVFVVPSGLGEVLPRACRPLVELSWWQHVTVGGVRIHLVPAQHWHRRGAFDTNRSLWGGFVLEGRHRVYHSGDTGYFGGFSAIGRVFGGIDAACLPLGAYEPKWFMATQHMDPDDSLRAHRDLGSSHFIGMHWGAFDLSDELLDAGPHRLTELAAEQRLQDEELHVILPGGTVALEGERGKTRAHTLHRYAPR